ncbi:MAG: hypothetical protein ACMXYC_04580, partial [Candidatus Woesearchaeota archaeon]
KHIAQHIHRIPIKVLTICIISAIFGMSFVFDSWIGVLCILTGTILGLLAVHLEVGRHFLMGCLLVPVVLFFM